MPIASKKKIVHVHTIHKPKPKHQARKAFKKAGIVERQIMKVLHKKTAHHKHKATVKAISIKALKKAENKHKAKAFGYKIEAKEIHASISKINTNTQLLKHKVYKSRRSLKAVLKKTAVIDAKVAKLKKHTLTMKAVVKASAKRIRAAKLKKHASAQHVIKQSTAILKNADKMQKVDKKIDRKALKAEHKVIKVKTVKKQPHAQHVIKASTAILKKADKMQKVSKRIDRKALKAVAKSKAIIKAKTVKKAKQFMKPSKKILKVAVSMQDKTEAMERAANIAQEKKDHVGGLASAGLPDTVAQWKKWQAKKDAFFKAHTVLVNERVNLAKNWFKARHLAVAQVKVVRWLAKKVSKRFAQHRNNKNVKKEYKLASEVLLSIRAQAVKIGIIFTAHEKKVKAHLAHGLKHNLV